MMLEKVLMVAMVVLGVIVLAMVNFPALGAEARPLSAEPVEEARLQAIAEDLRCLVCQNETLAASRAELAEDLRREIRGLIRQGKNDAEVVDFLVVRYGDFIRYRPPFKPMTWLLWLAPFLMLVAGLGLLYRLLSGRTDAAIEEEPEA